MEVKVPYRIKEGSESLLKVGAGVWCWGVHVDQ